MSSSLNMQKLEAKSHKSRDINYLETEMRQRVQENLHKEIHPSSNSIYCQVSKNCIHKIWFKFKLQYMKICFFVFEIGQ